jgi:hypothetical protein
MALTRRSWRLSWGDAAPWVLMVLIIGCLFAAAQIVTSMVLASGWKRTELSVLRTQSRRTMAVAASLQLRDSLRRIAGPGITVIASPLVTAKDAPEMRALVAVAIDSQLGHRTPRVPIVIAFGFAEKDTLHAIQETVWRYGDGFTSLPRAPGIACVQATPEHKVSWLESPRHSAAARFVSRTACLRFARYGVPGAALGQLVRYSKGTGSWFSDPTVRGYTGAAPLPAHVVQQETGIDLLSLACIAHGGADCTRLLRVPVEISALTGADLHMLNQKSERISDAIPFLLGWLENTMGQERFGALWQDDRPAEIAFPAHGLPAPGDAMRAALIWQVGPVYSSPPLSVREVLFGVVVIVVAFGFVLLARRRRQYVP